MSDPKSSIELLKKGNAFLTAGNRTNAIECYNQVLKIDPNCKDAFINKGNALLGTGDY